MTYLKLCTYNTSIEPMNQTQAIESTSDKYQFISTEETVKQFTDQGFEIVGVSNNKTRKKSREGFQKHLIALSREDLLLGEERAQLLLTNSHDGKCSYRLDFGVFRFACANGLVVGDTVNTVRIRHVGDVSEKIDQATKYYLDNLPLIAATVNEWKRRHLSQVETLQLALLFARARGGEGVVDAALPRLTRHQDCGQDAWTWFNRLQEVVIRGGLDYKTAEGEWKRTRKVSSIDTVTNLNKEMWNITTKLAAA